MLAAEAATVSALDKFKAYAEWIAAVAACHVLEELRIHGGIRDEGFNLNTCLNDAAKDFFRKTGIQIWEYGGRYWP